MISKNKLKFIQFILIIIFNCQFSYSQIYEVGGIFGGSNFIGDVGDTQFINPNESGFGGIIKWNRSPRHSYRLSFISTTKQDSPVLCPLVGNTRIVLYGNFF